MTVNPYVVSSEEPKRPGSIFLAYSAPFCDGNEPAFAFVTAVILRLLILFGTYLTGEGLKIQAFIFSDDCLESERSERGLSEWGHD